MYQPPQHPHHHTGPGHGPPPPHQVGGYGPTPGAPAPQQGPPPYPQQYYHQPTEQPSAHIAINIIGIFGCMSVLGIIGLVFGLQVGSRWAYGDSAGAEQASRTARVLGIISLIGTISLASIVALYVFGGLLAITLSA